MEYVGEGLREVCSGACRAGCRGRCRAGTHFHRPNAGHFQSPSKVIDRPQQLHISCTSTS